MKFAVHKAIIQAGAYAGEKILYCVSPHLIGVFFIRHSIFLFNARALIGNFPVNVLSSALRWLNIFIQQI